MQPNMAGGVGTGQNSATPGGEQRSGLTQNEMRDPMVQHRVQEAKANAAREQNIENAYGRCYISFAKQDAELNIAIKKILGVSTWNLEIGAMRDVERNGEFRNEWHLFSPDECKYFICILSDDYFKTPKCVEELRTSMSYGGAQKLCLCHKRGTNLGNVFQTATSMGFPNIKNIESIELVVEPPKYAEIVVKKINSQCPITKQ
mmetsp:Transcript_40858/g.97040  ORF Transcript_40858/g.97040 Transcript_40858/m.97040 type:complete len:203 (+) Transcript_40858:1-609(+)